ncbi:MAG: XdhC family protein [Planctomycetaceae bacterium]
MRKLLDDLLTANAAGRSVAITLLVETRGSTPQKAGASMLVYTDGSQSGTLGGGCVEAEVKRRALSLIPDGSPELMTFQLDSDYGWDDGLICGGRMRMLVDPIRAGDDLLYYRELARLVEGGRGCTEAVVLDAGETGVPELSRYLFDRDGVCVAQRASQPASASLLANLRPLSQRPRAYVAEGVSYLPHLARGKLLIVGGGHVGQRVADLAASVDFEVTVVDDRAEYVTEERFPSCVQRIAGQIDEVLPTYPVDEDTFCIVVTRGHNHDEEALFHLVRRPSRYLGMIGSKRKIKMIFDDLRREGIPEELLARVHAPLGIEIGSQSVPEIAISIVAELISCRNLSGRS